MVQFDVQRAFESLEARIQTERISIQNSIDDGFASINEELKRLYTLEPRVTALEAKHVRFGGGVLGVTLTALGSFLTWVFRSKVGN